MAPPKRPALSSIVEQKSRPVEPQAEAPAAVPRDVAPAPTIPNDLKTMQVRVNRAGWLEMTRLAQDLDKPLETLMVEAFNDILVKHSKPPVAERRQPIKK
ncbi:hypothetical protein IPV08_23795 [Methylobacterium sp. SD274]|uniref:hypothetical protein n=1 Tax=Methylobacterium sp. SD274 TaxID=2782009 RepID=UPI001A96DBFC|nr:hypothetical protein [Methylobacterium sp. SD274]MBO1022985.1 hypothetical protein [Methylobacterium sp. SD274]